MDNNRDVDALHLAEQKQPVWGFARLRRRGAAGRGQHHPLPDSSRGWRDRWLDGLGLPRDGGFTAGADPLRWSDDAPSSQQRVIPFPTRQRFADDHEPYSA